jgi:hypothetical protein
LLSTDGAYSPGHAAFGWSWALTRTEISPEDADAVLAS